VQTEADLPW